MSNKLSVSLRLREKAKLFAIIIPTTLKNVSASCIFYSFILDSSELKMDETIFKSAPYQRVFQYLRNYTAGVNLDSFQFSEAVEGTCHDFLDMIL